MIDLMIKAQGLTRHYKKLKAVRGINLEVRRGEIFGIVGPDGAGKTTTIQMLAGILTPTAGEIRVAGVDVVRKADRLGGKIGYMSEGFTLYGTLSVDENLDFFADLYGVPFDVRRERKEQLLQFARLEGARHRRAEHLSGGMKKKLALACTLMYSPQILFLDEPTTGVDPVSRRDFWKILHDWMETSESLTIFVSTPYMDEAERFDRVALMHQGQFIATDTPQALKAGLEGEMLDLKAEPQATALQVLRAIEGVSHVQVFGERLHLLISTEDSPEQTANLEATLAAAGITLLDQRRTEPTLGGRVRRLHRGGRADGPPSFPPACGGDERGGAETGSRQTISNLPSDPAGVAPTPNLQPRRYRRGTHQTLWQIHRCGQNQFCRAARRDIWFSRS
ncbi:MAG: ABC transporter ATP-binding protein [Anaerolineae bacterium]